MEQNNRIIHECIYPSIFVKVDNLKIYFFLLSVENVHLKILIFLIKSKDYIQTRTDFVCMFADHFHFSIIWSDLKYCVTQWDYINAVCHKHSTYDVRECVCVCVSIQTSAIWTEVITALEKLHKRFIIF